MTETPWTPGPWEAAERGDYGDFDGNSRVIIGDDRRIAVVQHRGRAEDEANTHLIKASPELYAALARAEQYLVLARRDCILAGPSQETLAWIAESDLEMVRAALAKARGETP